MSGEFGERRAHEVQVGGVAVTYYTAGVDRADARPIVLVHGIGGSTASDFSFLMPMLARKRLVVSIDFADPTDSTDGARAAADPVNAAGVVDAVYVGDDGDDDDDGSRDSDSTGSGSSERVGDRADAPGRDEDHRDSSPLLTARSLERQLEAVLGRVGTGRKVTLFGYSLGAVIAAAVAARTDSVAHLILAAGWLAPSARLRLHCGVAAHLESEGSGALGEYLVAAAYSAAYLETVDAEGLAGLVASVRSEDSGGSEPSEQFRSSGSSGASESSESSESSEPAGPAGASGASGASEPAGPSGLAGHSRPPNPAEPLSLRFAARQRALAGRIDISAVAPSIRAATLVIGCTDDPIATEQQSKALFAAIPDSRYAAITSGHALLVERPAQVLSMVDSFSEHPSRFAAGSMRSADHG